MGSRWWVIHNHLGNLAHHSGTSHREIRTKLAIGHAAFTMHRKLLFQNQTFSLQRRAELYKTLVLSKVAYGMETWLFEDKRTEKYYHGATIRLYRRLLKLPPDTALIDDEVIEKAMLPSPEIVLRITRLRYLALLYKCEEATPWALLRQDIAWCQLVTQDLHWLWTLIERTRTLPEPGVQFGPWEYILRYHRSYWKTLLQRCQHLHVRQHPDRILIRELHRAVLSHFEQHGTFRTAPIRPRLHLAQ